MLGLAAAPLAVLVFGASSGAPASPSCRWSVVASLGLQRVGFFGVAAGSPSSVWVIGTHWIYPNYNPYFTTALIEYWNGRRLSAVSSPGAASVAAIGRDAWTAGWTVGSLGKARKTPPTVHWKGRTSSRIPNPAGPGSTLNGIAMVSPQDVWVVGSAKDGRALVLHWNGSKWSKVVDPPGLGTGGTVTAVARIPETAGVWVDGTDDNANGFAARWTGSGWETYTVGPGGGTSGSLAAASSSSAWIVGQKGNATGTSTRDVIYHWDGSSWTEVPAPNPSPTHSSLSGVAARNDSDAWAVGYFKTGAKFHPLAVHWNGSKWSQVTAPGSVLTAVTTVPGTKGVWAVGSGVIERYKC